MDSSSVSACDRASTEAAPATALTAARPRLDGIDVLRGLAILAVIVLHVNIRVPLDKSPLGAFLKSGWPHALDLFRILVWNGYNGVIVFFAVSGFLITSNCLRRYGALRDISIRGFYRMRFARIAPLLVALLAVSSALHFAHLNGFVIDPAKFSWARAMFAALTFHVNWLEASQNSYLPANLDVLWSLSVEETFYLLFPLVCYLLRRNWALIVLLLGFVAAGPFARTVWTQNELWADHSYLSCMDAIALGCLAALAAARFRLPRKLSFAVRWTGLAMMILVTCFRRQCKQLGLYQHGLDVTVLALGAALLLIVIAQDRKPGTWLTAPLRWFGRNSYEVYLTHSFVVVLMTGLFVAWGSPYAWSPLWFVAVAAVSGVLGAAIAKYYSEPLNRKLRGLRRTDLVFWKR